MTPSEIRQLLSKVVLQTNDLAKEYDKIVLDREIENSTYWLFQNYTNLEALKNVNDISSELHYEYIDGIRRFAGYIAHIVVFLELLSEHTRISEVSSKGFEDHKKALKLLNHTKKIYEGVFGEKYI